MKNVMISPRVLAIALLASFTMAFTSPALANDEKKKIPVEMKFISNVDNQSLFTMTFNSAAETEFLITLRDEYGNVLYKEFVKGNITKRFLLNTEELNDVGLVFEVSANKTYKRAVFEVNKYTRTVEDVVVNRLK